LVSTKIRSLLNKTKNSTFAFMTSTRQNKVSRLLQKELSELFQREARNLFGGAMITVTVVRISPDLGDAKVYLSIFGVPDPDEILVLIKSNYKVIRAKLGEKVGKSLVFQR
jgi:ribosome-binding factor A